MPTDNGNTKFWAYLSQSVAIFSGILLLPILLRDLSPERYAIWIAFVFLSSLSLFLEQALEPALTRYVAYACAGSPCLPLYGTPPEPGDGNMNPQNIAEVLIVGRKIYALLSLFIAITLGVFGTLFLVHLTSKAPELKTETMWAWGFYLSGTLISAFWGYLRPVLIGLGDVTSHYQANTYSKGAYFLIATGGVLYTRSLIPIGVAYLVWAIVLRAYGALRLRRVLRILPAAVPDPQLFSAILLGSLRMGVSQFGAYLTLKVNYLLVSYYLGLQIAAIYGLSIQALETIMLLALIPIQYRLPQIISAKTTQKIKTFRTLVVHASRETWIISLLGIIGLLLLGPTLIKMISPNSSFLPTPMLMLMACTTFLAINHTIFVTLLLTENYVPFMWASLISGLIITFLTMGYLHFHMGGMLGVLLIEMLIQLSYNNWKWPREGCQKFNLAVADFF